MLCLFAVIANTGCTAGKGKSWQFAKSLDLRRAVGLRDDAPAPIQTPTRLVSTWTDTVLNRQGEPPLRGFGGRLMFFNDDSEDTIRVDGQLVVYAYDDSGRAEHETHPTRRYVFPREQVVRHESESKLGPSYSFWLPWDEVGGERKDIGLIARFEPHQGPRIVGEQTRHLLPGTTQLATGEKQSPKPQISDIQLTQYTQESKPAVVAAHAVASPSLQNASSPPAGVTSISLNKSWQERLQTLRNSRAQRKATESVPAAVAGQ